MVQKYFFLQANTNFFLLLIKYEHIIIDYKLVMNIQF